MNKGIILKNEEKNKTEKYIKNFLKKYNIIVENYKFLDDFGFDNCLTYNCVKIKTKDNIFIAFCNWDNRKDLKEILEKTVIRYLKKYKFKSYGYENEEKFLIIP